MKKSLQNTLKKSLLCLCTVFALTACQNDKNESAKEQTATQATAQTSEFVGCYGIQKDGIAQIKINHTDGVYTMQIKEPDGAKTLWDKSEALQTLSTEQAWALFKDNPLQLTSNDLGQTIARVDKLMALSKVSEAVGNVNPLLDGDYVVYLFGDVNVMYQLPCDDVPLDLVKSSVGKS